MKTQYSFNPVGICAKEITFTLDQDGFIDDVSFKGGCPGNSLGLTALVKGQKLEDVAEKLKGIRCGKKDSSCPDQLSIAIREYVSGKK